LQFPGFQVIHARAQPGKHQLTAHTVSLALRIAPTSRHIRRDIA